VIIHLPPALVLRARFRGGTVVELSIVPVLVWTLLVLLAWVFP
jgi:hypothetical protein